MTNILRLCLILCLIILFIALKSIVQINCVTCMNWKKSLYEYRKHHVQQYCSRLDQLVSG